MHIRFEEHWFNRFCSSFRKTSQQWESWAVCHWVLQCVATKKLLKKSQENNSATWRFYFQGSLLETIELDGMSSETLWLHSVLMKAQFCDECLAWKMISLPLPRHSYLLSNLSGREQFYICRVCKGNQQPLWFVFRQGQSDLFNLLICMSSWYHWIIQTWPTHSREVVTEALLQEV